jgi:phage terminase large subunit
MSAHPFDWRNPNYGPVIAQRIERLARLRAHPECLPALRQHYALHPEDFINDWGWTHDPRNVERGLPTITPFLLTPKQREVVGWIDERWRAAEPGLIEKSRDSGATWLTVGYACAKCLFNDGFVCGFGSRKVEYVDALGSPRAILPKVRFLLSYVPPEFLGGWTQEKHAPFMRILFPGTGSAIVGEGGDSIGRGDRTSIYIVDESAFLERPEMIDAALSQTTNCRIDISTPNGLNNVFGQKRFSGRVKTFTLHWRDDARKSANWYEKQRRELDPVTLASEVDINFFASIEHALIPSAWVQAAIGAHLRLGIVPSGHRYAGLDVADTGKDLNAIALRHGVFLEHLESWSGRNSDIYRTVVRAFGICEQFGYTTLHYDQDGLGAGVRGDACNINDERVKVGKPIIRDTPFRGSGAVWNPDSCMIGKRLNKDYFANAKAQAWFALRQRFQMTHRAVVERMPYAVDDIISINPCLPELTALQMELAQVTYGINAVGKVVIDKQPDNMRSPNLADAVVIAFQPSTRSLEIWARIGS